MSLEQKIADAKKTKIQCWINANLLKRIEALRNRKGLKRNILIEMLLEEALR